jgi:hypothetical protein
MISANEGAADGLTFFGLPLPFLGGSDRVSMIAATSISTETAGNSSTGGVSSMTMTEWLDPGELGSVSLSHTGTHLGSDNVLSTS